MVPGDFHSAVVTYCWTARLLYLCSTVLPHAQRVTFPPTPTLPAGLIVTQLGDVETTVEFNGEQVAISQVRAGGGQCAGRAVVAAT